MNKTTWLARRAARILGAVRMVGQDRTPAIPNYSMLAADQWPTWLEKSRLKAEWGQPIGVYTNTPASASRALILTDEGLLYLEGEANEQWLPYDDIERYDRLSKSPPSKSVVFWTKRGTRMEFPLEGQPGDTFALVQFVLNALRPPRITRNTSRKQH